MTLDGGKPTRDCAGCGEPFTPSSPRQKYHSAQCRNQSRRKAKTAEPTPEDVVVRWAVAHGAPVRILEGWNPDTGEWHEDSPVGKVLVDVHRGVHPAAAGRRYHLNIDELTFKGAEFRTSENRMLIPIEVRPFTDFYDQLSWVEVDAESELVTTTYEKALKDPNPSKGLEFLGRRWPSRWREQQQVSMIAEDDPREAAVTKLLSDPAKAAALAAMADEIEDEIEEQERTGG